MLRRFVERFSRNRVLKRRLPVEVGGNTIYVSPDSALSYWRRDLQVPFGTLFAWAQNHVSPGSTVWDIGANVGLFSFAAAASAGVDGRVIAVEPDQFLVQLLRRTSNSLSVNCAPVTVIPAAVSDAVSIACLNLANRGRSSNHLADINGSRMRGGVRRQEQVVSVTLDWLAEFCSPPNVVKVDVEGAELKVLQGAEQVLGLHRPRLICEVRPQHRHEISQLLKNYAYALFDANDPKSGQLELSAFNTLAIPKEEVSQHV